MVPGEHRRRERLSGRGLLVLGERLSAGDQRLGLDEEVVEGDLGHSPVAGGAVGMNPGRAGEESTGAGTGSG